MGPTRRPHHKDRPHMTDFLTWLISYKYISVCTRSSKSMIFLWSYRFHKRSCKSMIFSSMIFLRSYRFHKKGKGWKNGDYTHDITTKGIFMVKRKKKKLTSCVEVICQCFLKFIYYLMNYNLYKLKLKFSCKNPLKIKCDINLTKTRFLKMKSQNNISVEQVEVSGGPFEGCWC